MIFYFIFERRCNMEKLRKMFKSSRRLREYIDKNGGVTKTAKRLKVDRKVLYNFRDEMGIL